MKAACPISVTEEGIVICVNDAQLAKVHFLIEITEGGISNVICVNNVHSSQKHSLISVIEEETDICFNDAHLFKIRLPFEVTEDGIDTWVNDEHLQKAATRLELNLLHKYMKTYSTHTYIIS